ncbi:phage tail tape measure protein [Niallia sp. FSL R7-0648]|uniref:phage tail tape measure protein n=1 Tax=Niallia sp. FSL R7-0648 TaxID=2954521 RepID=UPI0030F91D41
MAERIEGLSIGLDLDSTALNRGLKGLKDQLRTVNSEMKANLSAFDRGERSVAKYETIITGLNRKLQVQESVTTAARQEYEKMVREHGEGSREAERAARSYNNEVAALNTLQRRLQNTQRELADFREEQRQAESGFNRLGRRITDTGESLTKFGDKTKNIGTSLTAGLTAPITGLGIAAGKSALEFDKASGNIQADLGITEKQAKKLNDVATELWKDGFGDSIEGVSTKIAGVTKALGDLSKVDLSYVTQGLDLFERRGWADQQEALRAINILMKQFGMSASDAMDYITRGFQENLDYSGEFLDSISEYSTYYAEFGMSAEDMFAKFKAGAETGAFQLDKIGDAMKEFTLRAKDGSKSSTEAYKALGLNAKEMTKQFNKGGEDAKKAFEKVVKAIRNTKDEGERNAAAVGLFGTQYEDLGGKAFDAMLSASKGLENVEGATKKASDALQDNLGTRASKVWRDFVADMQPVGETMLDIAEDVLPKVADTVENVTSAFADLSPEGQKTILAIAGIGAAAGPTLIGVGALATSVGSLAKIVGPLIPALGSGAGLSGVLAGLAGPLGITALAVGGLGLGFIALDKEMDKPIIKSDIFKGKISEATKQAVGSYMELDEQATAELNSLAWSNQTITDEMANNMVSRYQEMGDQVLQAMKENHNEQLAEQQRLFAESDVLTEQEEAKRLAKLKAKQLEEEKAHTEQQARIKEIWTLAAEEKRGITDAEANEIAKLQEQMRTKAVEELTASQEEQVTILNNMKGQKGILEAETAANTVKKSAETRDKVIKDANKQYAETVSYAETARDELGIISSDEAKKIIKEAERKRNKTVSKAEDMHYDVVDEAQKQAKEHVDEVDWETGEVLSGWDKMYNGVIDAVNWVRDLFGKKPLSKKGTIKETGRQTQRRQNAKLTAKYADGTSSTGHPGGPAIVGEEGIELAHIPGHGVTLLGTNGPEFLTDLPRGSSVLPNKHTERLLKSYGFPGYADGIGDYFDLFIKGAGSVWDMVKGKFGLSDGLIPSWLTNHTGSPLSYIGDMAKGWIKDTWDSWFGSLGSLGGKGSGVKKWAGLATKALMLTNQFTQSNLDRLLYQMQTESGGNPKAINLWDSNAKKGIPSKGLMQVIDPTFRAYAMPGFDKDVYDPLSNILASIRYAVSRYGSLAKAYRGIGYETGGLVNTAGMYQLAEGGWPEYVIPTDPNRRTDAMKLLALAGKQIQGNKRPNQLPNVSASGNSDFQEVIERQDKQIGLMQQQIDLLSKLLLKSNIININDETIEKSVSNLQAKKYGNAAYMMG